MTLLDLFSGIGGFSLAARWAGIETIQFVEIDPFCQKVLAKNFPGVPIHDDIKTFKAEPGSADIVSGGFPCQPFSCAGKRRGKEDDRYLWPEMRRVISEARPSWVIAENVTGIDGMALKTIISDMESIKYEVLEPLEIPACAVGSPQRRSRIWLVSHALCGIKAMGGRFEEVGGSQNKYRGTIYAREKVNPQWWEWLMGYPAGWTDLNPSEMPSSHR